MATPILWTAQMKVIHDCSYTGHTCGMSSLENTNYFYIISGLVFHMWFAIVTFQSSTWVTTWLVLIQTNEYAHILPLWKYRII